jgi:hypothetical protein
VVEVPAVAGPFNLGTVIVRQSIQVDPHTAQVSVISDPFPAILDGVPLQIRDVKATIDRPEFTFNPTSCDPLQVGGRLTSVGGRSIAVSSRFQAAACASLPFGPSFTVSTQGKTSKSNGASLDVKVRYPTGSQANIRSVKVNLPRQLPSRLTTLQKACVAAVFESNPAQCPPESIVGSAKAQTPVLSAPLVGPAYLVSHAAEAFPSLVIVLQAEGVRIDLTGQTFIKKGITSSNFATVPDAPVSFFELYLPEGPHSALGATANLCGQKLQMPTKIVGQNGAVIKQTTPIRVTGCPKQAKRRKSASSRKGRRVAAHRR